MCGVEEGGRCWHLWRSTDKVEIDDVCRILRLDSRMLDCIVCSW